LAVVLHITKVAMRIAQVAPLFEAVPPQLYGGTERVVSHLTEELVRRGHDVTLFASGDSQTAATLVPVVPRAMRLGSANRDLMLVDLIRELDMVFTHAGDFDVIHCHVDYLAFPFGNLVRTPTVHTLHGRQDLDFQLALYRHFARTSLISISDAQREPLRDLDLAWAGTVYHGLPLESYPYAAQDRGYLAFLGRLAPEKQPDVAIEVARRAGVPLKIAAKVDDVDREYFEQVVKPLLDDPLVEFIGEIGEADKAAFLGGARALLFPIDWPEPFGLVMIEAMACGTPVIARPYGSVPEVVVPGRTGFVGDTLVELAEAVKRLDEIERADCRAHVEQHFTVSSMSDGYEAVYRRLGALRRAA
jgi:glycosyltransferase involved in cell wall biosynthesis